MFVRVGLGRVSPGEHRPRGCEGERREKRKGTAGSMEEKGRVSVVYERRLEEENKARGRERERDG